MIESNDIDQAISSLVIGYLRFRVYKRVARTSFDRLQNLKQDCSFEAGASGSGKRSKIQNTGMGQGWQCKAFQLFYREASETNPI